MTSFFTNFHATCVYNYWFLELYTHIFQMYPCYIIKKFSILSIPGKIDNVLRAGTIQQFYDFLVEDKKYPLNLNSYEVVKNSWNNIIDVSFINFFSWQGIILNLSLFYKKTHKIFVLIMLISYALCMFNLCNILVPKKTLMFPIHDTIFMVIPGPCWTL